MIKMTYHYLVRLWWPRLSLSLSLSLSPSNKMNKKQIVWSNADLLGTHELLNFAYLYVHIIEKDQHSWLCRNLSGLLEEI